MPLEGSTMSPRRECGTRSAEKRFGLGSVQLPDQGSRLSIPAISYQEIEFRRCGAPVESGRLGPKEGRDAGSLRVVGELAGPDNCTVPD